MDKLIKRRIKFAENTKDHDGPSKKVELFYDVFKNFSKGKYDIDKILKKINNDIKMLTYFINEILIIKEKLEKIDIEITFYNLFCDKKEYIRFIPVLRNGASISRDKVTVKHLPIINKFLFDLVNAKENINY